MTSSEKYVARRLFKLLVLQADGQVFQDLFCDVMRRVYPNFRKTATEGRVGDHKTDAIEYDSGSYFAVYGPEDVAKGDQYGAKKLADDFEGIVNAHGTNTVKVFRYVLNDKYKGAGVRVEEAIQTIRNSHPHIDSATFLARDLEDVFHLLSDADTNDLLGPIPSPEIIDDIDYNVMGEVIRKIMENDPSSIDIEDYERAELDHKIEFNGLSPIIGSWLKIGNYQVSVVSEYFRLESNFAKDDLKKIFVELYKKAIELHDDPDDAFMYIAQKACPRLDQAYWSCTMVLMSYYFEYCDIFEKP